MTHEESVEGAVKWPTYLAYIQAGGGLPAIVVVLAISILAEGTRAFSFWWLALWLQDGSGVGRII